MSKSSETEEYVFILGQSMPRRELIKLISIALGVVCAFVIAGWFLYQDRLAANAANEVKQQEARLREELQAQKKVEQSVSPLKAFFAEYFRLTRMNEVETIRAVGTYTVGNIDMDLTLLARRPRYYKQSLSAKGREIEFAYDGGEVWLYQSHEIIDPDNLELMKLNKSLAVLESAIPCLAWDYDPLDKQSPFELMPEENWNGNACYVVQNRGLLDGVVYHYIDKETGFEHRRRALLEIKDDERTEAELIYEAPDKEALYVLPSGMELYLDGELFYKEHFDQVKVNTGIPTFLFEPKTR